MIGRKLLRRVLFWGGVVLTVGLVGRSVILKVERKVAQQAEQIASLAAEGHDKFLWSMAEISLEHLASLPEVKRMEERACEQFESDFEQEVFAVIALGDSEGETICLADPEVKEPYPTMSDRLYFKRAKEAEGLVAGEYAISRTTGKEVLHFAYPVKEEGEFRGLVMAGLDLSWLVDEVVDKAFEQGGVELMITDRGGRVLLTYPLGLKEVGESGLNIKLLNFYLGDKEDYKVLKGLEGTKRVFVYKFLGDEKEVVLFVGVEIGNYYRLLVWVIILIILLIWARCFLRDHWKKLKKVVRSERKKESL